jgi:hypothetical protein
MSRVLTFNCHEGYVHLLGKLGCDIDIVDGLPGRDRRSWDLRARPVPLRARLIDATMLAASSGYDVAIAHNVTDLLLLRDFDMPKVLVLHVSLAARAREEPRAPPISAMRAQLDTYLRAISAMAVAVSENKAASWGQRCPVIRPCADPDEYAGFTGDEPSALRVANHVMRRPERFAWDAHLRIILGHACTLVGDNPELGSAPAPSWEALRGYYRSHRAYVHSAGAELDDGYNLGVVEAMMTGMPVVSLAGAESPVIDSVNGFVSGDTDVLRARLGQLLGDRAFARELGARARATALERFSVAEFIAGWHAALDQARQVWRRARGVAVA